MALSLAEALTLLGSGPPSQAQTQAFTIVYQALQGLTSSLQGNWAQLAEDAASAAAVKLHTSHNFHQDMSKSPMIRDKQALGYLHTTLRHCCQDLARKNRADQHISFEEDHLANPHDPPDHLEAREEHSQLEDTTTRFHKELVPSIASTLRRDGQQNFRDSVLAMWEIAYEEASYAQKVEQELQRAPIARDGTPQTLAKARDALHRRLCNARKRLIENVDQLLQIVNEAIPASSPHQDWLASFLWTLFHLEGFQGITRWLRLRAPKQSQDKCQ